MKHTKKDFQIVFKDHDKYIVEVRKRFLKFFYKWIPVTYQEAENTEEKVLEFESFEAATNFVDLVTN